jgi:predicted nucleic acid-binding protein
VHREEPPDVSYLDTSVIVAATISGLPNGGASAAFCSSLVVQRKSVAISRIVWLELAQSLRNLASRPGQLPPDLFVRFQLDQWQVSPLVRHRWMRFGVAQFEELMARFVELFEIPFDDAVWRRSVGIMATDGLQSHDAVHVATARVFGVPQFVTLDDHFNRVRDLDVWLIRDPIP